MKEVNLAYQHAIQIGVSEMLFKLVVKLKNLTLGLKPTQYIYYIKRKYL